MGDDASTGSGDPISTPLRPCVLVPSHNHAEALPSLVQHMATLALPVLIVDDGSRPDVAQAIDRLTDGNRVWRLRHDQNQGKGAAVLNGLRALAAKGYTQGFQIDADGQHDLAAVAAFLETAKAHPDAVIAGAPQFDHSIPFGRRIGRRITDFWVAVHTLSLKIDDSMCGFRVYPIAPTLALADRVLIGRGMDFDIEILVRLYWASVPIGFLPVKVVYPEGNLSNFRMLRDNLAISWMHTRLFFGMLVRLPRLLLGPTPILKLDGRGEQHWADQAERGSYWGLRLLAAIYSTLGRRACLAMMVPVVLYFFATGREQREASARYLQRLHEQGHLEREPRWTDQFRHFMSFAAASLDKLAAWSGHLPRSAMRGIEGGAFAAAKDASRGAVVLTAHLGNPEVIRAIADLNQRWQVNVLVGTANAERFNRLIKRFAPTSTVRLIQVTDLGVDQAILLREAIERGEWVVSVADRVPIGQSDRICWLPFLGRPAPFPQGPFILAAILKAPVYSMFCLREDATYRVCFDKLADRLELPRKQRVERLEEVMSLYVQRLEHHTVQAPMQWYNFYDFWHPAGVSRPAALSAA
ncbi:MAG: glycosyltransferase [Pseudomonadota bacterium]